MSHEKPGPAPGSPGARSIGDAHRGSHTHDSQGGFATNPQLAREAGRKGGKAVKAKYGPGHFAEIGRRGGETVKQERGSDFYAEIGRKGGEMRGQRMEEAREAAKASKDRMG